jgi:hypothetical protein
MAPRTSHQPHLKATQKPQQLAGMEVPPAVRMERMKGGVEVAVNLEAAGHIRSGDAELPGGGEHEPNRLGRAHLERGERIPRPGRAPVIGPKRNRGIVINERPKDIPESHPRPSHDSRPDQWLFVATDVHTLLPVRKSHPTTVTRLRQ